MHRSLIALTILLFVLAVGAETTSAFQITFKFDPPDDLSYRGVVTSVRVNTLKTDTEIDSIYTSYNHHMIKIEGGWQLSSVPDSSRITRNGSPLNDPVRSLLSMTELTRTIDQSAQISKVEGYDKTFEALDTILEPLQAQYLRTVLSPESLEETEKSDWATRVANWNGRTLNVGDLVLDSSAYAVPGGIQVRYLGAYKLVDTLRIDGVLCARINVYASTEPDKFANMLRMTLDEMMAEFGLTVEEVNSYRGQQNQSVAMIERTVEVNTLLNRKEVIHREFRRVSQDTGGVFHENIEDQVKDYSYDK